MSQSVTIITEFFKGTANGIKTAFNSFVYTSDGIVTEHFKNGLEWLLTCVALAVVVTILGALIKKRI